MDRSVGLFSLVVFSWMLVILCSVREINGVPYKVKGRRGSALLNEFCQDVVADTTMEHCLENCLEECPCTSFQMCDRQCQLCTSPYQSSKSVQRSECVHYDLELKGANIQNDGYCMRHSCLTGVNCCRTSQPCFNGGTCLPVVDAVNLTDRYTCKCPVGFTGRRCQTRIRSCGAYFDTASSRGIYKIVAADGTLLDVFCDFDAARRVSWTLIQSYKLSLRGLFQKSFFSDSPSNRARPIFGQYRLSKGDMESIKAASSKWRMTCNYDSNQGLPDRVDYVEGAIGNLDILALNGGQCVLVDYINIRGYNCMNCTTHFFQSHNKEKLSFLSPLHVDNWRERCTFHPGNKKNCYFNGYEDNFGFYECTNHAHRCVSTSSSTTQTWFGSVAP